MEATDGVIDGAALRRLREGRGLGQRELARLASVDHSVVSRIERDVQRDVGIVAVVAIARVLGVPVDNLLAMPTGRAPAPLVGELAAEVATLGTLPPIYQRHLAGLLRAYRSGLPVAETPSDAQ